MCLGLCLHVVGYLVDGECNQFVLYCVELYLYRAGSGICWRFEPGPVCVSEYRHAVTAWHTVLDLFGVAGSIFVP